MSTSNLLIVGSVAYDDVETPQAERKDLLGGSATYFSLAASHLSQAIRLVGVVGRDFGDNERSLLKDRGIDMEGLVTDPSGDTFRWGGRYHANMNERSTTYNALNVFEHFKPVLPASYTNSPWLFLGNIDPDLQVDVLNQVTSPKFVALDTMNFWIEGKRESLLKALKQVNGIVINDEEGVLLTGESDWLAMARGVRALGPETVIIKRGADGAILYHNDTLTHFPAFAVQEVVDPTGAGDTFAGGLMASLATAGHVSTESLKEAVMVGTVLASYCVEGFGVERVLSLQPKDIQGRLAQLRDQVSPTQWTTA